MMGKTICYIATYLAEALITYIYAGTVFVKKRRSWSMIAIYILLYTVLYSCFDVGNVILNAVLYFLGMYLLLFLNYECKSKTAFLHGAFLSSMLLLTEFLAILLINIVTNDVGAYQDSLSVLIAMAVVSKLLYLAVMVISVRFLPQRHMRLV